MTEPTWILPLSEVGPDDVARVGGKGANLGALVAAGLAVPDGLCVTTEAFDAFMAQDPGVAARLEALDELPAGDVEGVRHQAAALREHLGGLPVPQLVARALREALEQMGLRHAYAVRSSATLEDLPDASFAGQQDTFLEVRGAEEIERRVRDGWVSLFTDRAVLYRRQQGYASRAARLAVVVQRMVRPQVSGILFTADPVTGHRGVCSIDASYGLGEALVSGLVDADLYRVDRRTLAMVELRVGAKAIAIHPLDDGGTETRPVPEADRERRCLDDEQVAALVHLGERVEALQGRPQDLEWCIEDGELFLVQARAITSLYPLPEPPPPDDALRVYASFGHIQVNTTPMPPMARSVVGHLVPFFKPAPDRPSPMAVAAGGRIYLDLSVPLSRWPLSRLLPVVLREVEAGIGERLAVVQRRPAFREAGHERALPRRAVLSFVRRLVPQVMVRLWWASPERARERYQEAIDAACRDYDERFAAAQPGVPRLREAIAQLGRFMPELLARTHFPVLMAGMAAWRLCGWLMRGRVPESTIDSLTRGLPGNVTTQMDLELGDLADRAREVPGLAERLREGEPAAAIERARSHPGAEGFVASWEAFLRRYGHRGPGEIDVTVPRWSDAPTSLITSLLGILGNEPGAHRRRHQAAEEEARLAEATILEAAGRGLGGWFRRRVVGRLVRCVRAYLGLREHGKFVAMKLFAHVRAAILEAGALAVERGRLRASEDAWMLELRELAAALEGTGPSPHALTARVEARREELRACAKLVPPRVMTSEGEQPPLPDDGAPLCPGELAGLAASAGVIEGRARVVLDPSDEVLEAGEILVAPFTDPGWTPLFVHAAGLVMEIGGLMTHGSVVAREYGLPAVVGVEGATTRIHTGQRIRIDGDRGRVVLLHDDAPPAEDA